MLRNVIESARTVEVHKVSQEVKRGSLVVKNLATKSAGKATGDAVDVFVVDFDAQPTGHLADSEVSAYDPSMDTIKANSNAILVTYGVGGHLATDQIEGNFEVGNFATAKDGLFSPAEVGAVSKFKFVGNYNDGDKVLKQFAVVDPQEVK